MSNQQPQRQDTTPQLDRRIMLKIRVQERESRGGIRECRGGAKKHKRLQKSYRRDVENGGDYD